MNRHRILLLSCARPSRAWRVANRISRDLPGAEVCGIAQQSIRKLAIEQQLIASGRLDDNPAPAGVVARARLRFRSALLTLIHYALRWIHACPRFVPSFVGVSIKKLIEECGKTGWPILVGEDMECTDLVDFVRRQRADLGIALGTSQLTQNLLELPSLGWINVYHQPIESGVTNHATFEVTVDYLKRGSAAPLTITSVALPRQPYDTPAALTLKADLIADDLLRKTVIGLLNEDAVYVRETVAKWAEKIFSPYLQQLKSIRPKIPPETPVPLRHRAAWRLFLQTLLSSPLFACRNWYRRWNDRCPVTILTHHLVSDRPHPMGISTEVFWKQARFLQKHYRIVSLREATDLLHSGHLRMPTVVLTFDDGYADNFVSLRAVAEELDIPVVLFIATDAVEGQREFEHDLSVGIQGAMPLTWDHIRYWSTQGAEFGSHTRTHFDCGSKDRTRLEEEIIGAKDDLEVQLGAPIESFAFPFGGRENISPISMEIAVSSHHYFLSSVGGENLPSGTRNGHLLRKGFYSDPWEMELDVQGVFELLEKGKRKLREIRQRRTTKNLFAAAATTAAGPHSLREGGTRTTAGLPASFDTSSGM